MKMKIKYLETIGKKKEEKKKGKKKRKVSKLKVSICEKKSLFKKK